LALTTPLLDASETDERRYASKMNLENRKNRGSSRQYMGWMSERISLRLPVAGEVFFLDIPFYRTCYKEDIQLLPSFGEPHPGFLGGREENSKNCKCAHRKLSHQRGAVDQIGNNLGTKYRFFYAALPYQAM
jgi:hypothetical protein